MSDSDELSKIEDAYRSAEAALFVYGHLNLHGRSPKERMEITIGYEDAQARLQAAEAQLRAHIMRARSDTKSEHGPECP